MSRIRKRIAVNALTVDSRPSGGRTYLINLLEEMTEIAGDEYQFYILASRAGSRGFSGALKSRRMRLILFPSLVGTSGGRVAVEQTILPVWLLWKRIDLLFAARNVMPVFSPCPTVIGIHSMHLNYEQGGIGGVRGTYGRALLRLSAKKAKAYVAVSEYAGLTYIKKYSVPRELLFIAPNGLRREVESSGRGSSNPIGCDYLLFVSSLLPHKNVPFLIRVFNEISKRRPGTKLVIAGRNVGTTLRELKTLAEELRLSEKIHFTGAVSEHELSILYTHASVFVFPSLIEGFGLTPLEAMAHSVPVVVSNRTSIPEVVGDAGVVLAPEDDSVWADAIMRILENDGVRKELSVRARERSRFFTWRHAAEITLQSFDVALKGNRGGER